MLIRPRALRTAAWCTSLVLTGGCAVDPPPAPQSTQASQSLAPAPKASQIIMAIDSIGAGFNPHLLSDQSPVNAAVSALVFPSSFRPVPDPASPTGSRWVMDPNLLVSATVTSNKPFTVTYRIRPEAAWTDNAPIAADDFWYLWRQMVSQPGVVDPAGYDLITGVQSVDGGKTAVVTFAQPYPAWRELFNDLVPAHIVKDAPGGFAAGLSRVLPVTGGQFRVDNIDPQRDEILLARNDRFWGAPAKPDQILFRRGGAPAALADSIRNGDTQVAQVHGGSAAFAQLATIPDVRTGRILTPRVMQLTLRGRQPKLSDPVLRKAILGLLDVDLLATVGAGSDNSVTLDQALVRAPSDPGYQATAPASLGRERALQLFAEAGYRVDRSPTELRVPPVPDADDGAHPPGSTRDRISRNGQTLALVIGAAANDPTSVAVANTAADQLRGAGLAATVLALDPATLYGPALEQNRVDAIVGWRSAGGDLATLLASRYSCPALDAVPIATTGARPPVPAPPPAAQPGATTTPVSTTSVSTTPVSTTPVSTTPVSTTPVSTTPVSTTSVSNTPATTTSEPSPGPAPLVRAPSNLGGVCDRDIQPKIDGALSGALNIDDVIAAVEPRLWALATELPIMQDSTIVAIGPGVANVSLNGAIPVGIVGDAGRWVKTSP